ncbi:hypothetical protein [Methanorbis furvi]|uniref:Uncharacterized protein n=1 Tax=Methanorbis furvi TaxID=3028299 RepID=A0AAE4SAN8_9EURY|nr:hypothetical protein [Methanocorpusculaceae archaeon Ag1]
MNPRWMYIPQLMDRDWLLKQKISGRSAADIGRELEVSERTVRTALTYHKIAAPYARISEKNPELKERLDRIQ